MSNKEIVAAFYTAFNRLDFAAMNNCLSDDIIYNDPVYGILKGDVVRAMWEMKCQNLKDFSLKFSNIQQLDEEYVTCNWESSYYYAATGRNITMPVKAFMKIEHGKITEHSDAYRFNSWISKAYGWRGVLFGWTGSMKRKIQNKYSLLLDKFIQHKSLFNTPGKRQHDYDFSDM